MGHQSTSPLVMMALFLLLPLTTAVLAAPSPMADYDGSDAEFEDFDNLTMSRAAEVRAINTCNCAPVSSSDRIVGGKEVNPKHNFPTRFWFRRATNKEIASCVEAPSSTSDMWSRRPTARPPRPSSSPPPSTSTQSLTSTLLPATMT